MHWGDILVFLRFLRTCYWHELVINQSFYRNSGEPSPTADENIPGLGNRSATPDSSRCSSAAGLPLAAGGGGCSSPEYRVTSDESRSASRLSKEHDADAASISSDDAGKFDAGDDDDVDSVDV
jgi:hypothetical protein